MDVGAVIRSMRGRMPWSVGYRVLREHGLQRAQGWDRTVSRLSEASIDDELTASLAQSLKEHLLCGEKLVRFYLVDQQQKEAMIEGVLKMIPEDGCFSRLYPAIVPEDQLVDAPKLPVLIAVENRADEVAAVFASVRAISLSETLSRDDLSEQTREEFTRYDELVGIRHVQLEAVDVVSIPKTAAHVNVRVDYPHGTHREVGAAAQTQVKTVLSQLIDKYYLTSPLNLFPLIDDMYINPKEGIVVELAFGTTTASLKHEKMRRKATCLRQEAYHRGGKAALAAPIEPHRLSVLYNLPLVDGSSTPELGLHGRLSTAGSQNPVLLDAIIKNCMGEADFRFIHGRIELYLAKAAQASAIR